MKIINEDLDIRDFKAWSGAVETQKRIVEEDKWREFNEWMEEIFPDGLTETKLNDILWFEEEWVFEELGIKVEKI